MKQEIDYKKAFYFIDGLLDNSVNRDNSEWLQLNYKWAAYWAKQVVSYMENYGITNSYTTHSIERFKDEMKNIETKKGYTLGGHWKTLSEIVHLPV